MLIRPKEDWIAIGIVTLIALGICGIAHAEPNYEELANAIYKAEGGVKASHPYGIMTHYKTTTARQACINTARHAWRDYAVGASNTSKEGYIAFLGARYCPTKGEALRPQERALNGYWIGNVTRLYKGGV